MKKDQQSNEINTWMNVAEESSSKPKDVTMDSKVTKEILEVDKDVRNYLKRIAEQNKVHKIIIRSMLSGVFTAFGATVVFAILIFILSQIINNADNIPLIGDIIEGSHLEKFIPDQLE